jgi:hypothetical protein
MPRTQQLVSVLWPSFLVAAATTVVFFTLFDPLDLALLAGVPELSRIGGYTIGFFFFWLITGVACSLTCYFRRPCSSANPS